MRFFVLFAPAVAALMTGPSLARTAVASRVAAPAVMVRLKCASLCARMRATFAAVLGPLIMLSPTLPFS